MSTYVWPNEDGWPYPDAELEVADIDALIDDDALLIRDAAPHLFDALEPLERRVVTAHYGFAGGPPRTMKELHTDLGMTRAEVRQVLASGLAKLRVSLSA